MSFPPLPSFEPWSVDYLFFTMLLWKQKCKNTRGQLQTSNHQMYTTSKALKKLKAYNHFSNDLFVVQKSDRRWDGIPTDQVNEICLMQNMKTSGNITEGKKGFGFFQCQFVLLFISYYKRWQTPWGRVASSMLRWVNQSESVSWHNGNKRCF